MRNLDLPPTACSPFRQVHAIWLLPPVHRRRRPNPPPQCPCCTTAKTVESHGERGQGFSVTYSYPCVVKHTRRDWIVPVNVVQAVPALECSLVNVEDDIPVIRNVQHCFFGVFLVEFHRSERDRLALFLHAMCEDAYGFELQR